MVRLEVDNVASMVELDDAPWTPELVQTLLRMCGDEVVRTVTAIGVAMTSDADDEDRA